MLKLINRDLILQLVHRSFYTIIQDSKRLRTFQVPQQKDIHPIPKQTFDDALLFTLIRLQTAFQSLKSQQTDSIESSKIKSITLTGVNKLEIQSGQGWFIFQGKNQLFTLFYNSPFNGPFKYYYDLATKRWLSNKDNHILEQNLAREVQGKFFAYLDI